MSTELTKRELRAVRAAHSAMNRVLDQGGNDLCVQSFSRVAVALSGRCQGIEHGITGDEAERAVELETIQQQHYEAGFLKATETAGTA